MKWPRSGLVGVATCAVVICVLIGLYTGLYLTRVAGIGLPHPGRAGAASPHPIEQRSCEFGRRCG